LVKSGGQLRNSYLDIFIIGGPNDKLPVQVTSLKNVTVIIAGANHSLALKNDGTAWSSDDNSWGQLGRLQTNNSMTFVWQLSIPIYRPF